MSLALFQNAGRDREVWITGCGLASALGEGLEAHWQTLGDPASWAARRDEASYPPFHIHPIPAGSLDLGRYIPRAGDQRAMGPLMHYGCHAAGLALEQAGALGDAELLGRMQLVAASGGGERDMDLDEQILSTIDTAADTPGADLNTRLMDGLRPTLFLAQLPNLFAGNISLVLKLSGASRTFMGEEPAGLDAARIAAERIAGGQGDIFLVGGAFNADRRDLLLSYVLVRQLLDQPWTRLWDRPEAGMTLGSAGAFLVMESRAHAQARGAKPLARLAAVLNDRADPDSPGAATRRQINGLSPLFDRQGTEAPLGVMSGAFGSRRQTQAERAVLSDLRAGRVGPLGVRGTAAALGHTVEASFLANLALATACLQQGRLFPPLDSEEPLEADAADLACDRVLVTGMGHLRGEGVAVVEAVAD